MITLITSLSQRFSKPNPDAYSHIQAIDTQTNQLLKQSISEQNLDDALAWLQNTNKEQDNSDVWHYSKHWQQHKAKLQQRLLNGTFNFQTVRDVEIKNKDGNTEHREIRCAEDRLLIRAISQTLKPYFDQSIAKECTHLSGRGGTKAPVDDSHAQLLKQPKAHVMKSDVKGYYAHIDHIILHTQFCTLLPQETELQRLLWQFLQRTVERGGNYRDIDKGIPLGASLSPLLGALYLSPLDALFTQTPQGKQHFYRRYMDDWVIFCKNRWDLRNTVKQVYAVLHTLRVDIAPKKTYIGKASKGFDFLGKRILPIGILPSAAALSRMQRNTVRLYEQGASKRRIGLYCMRWLCWAVPCVASSISWATECTTTFAAPVRGGSACFCVVRQPSGALQFVSGIDRVPSGAPGGHTNVTPVSVNDAVGSHVFTNTTSTRVPQQQYSCDWNGSQYSNSKILVANNAPAITSNGGGDTATLDVSENQTTVTTVTAADTDGDTITFSLTGGSDQAKFSIGGSTGVLTFASAPDFENPTDSDKNNTYVVEVTATDDGTGTQTDTQTITVTVTNVNESTAGATDTTTTPEVQPTDTSTATNAGVFGGEKVTPSTFELTVSKIEFKNAQGNYVTFAEEGTSYDVASVAANQAIGTFGKTSVLPNGSYSQIRVTLSRHFSMSFSGSDKGSACRTNSGGATGNLSSALTNVSIGSSDGGTATVQQISFPSGSIASSALGSASISESGDNLQITAPASFTVSDTSKPPKISINIDAADAAEVLTFGGNCNVLPEPPKVTVSVGG